MNKTSKWILNHDLQFTSLIREALRYGDNQIKRFITIDLTYHLNEHLMT